MLTTLTATLNRRMRQNSPGRESNNAALVLFGLGFLLDSQRAQYTLIKEYGLNYIGLQIMIYAIFFNYGVLGSRG